VRKKGVFAELKFARAAPFRLALPAFAQQKQAEQAELPKAPA